MNFPKKIILLLTLGLPFSTIMSIHTKSHYNQNYWNYQRKMAEAGGVLNKFMFEEFITSQDTVIDWGCSGGFLLNNLKCKKKIGIEINLDAIECACKLGIDVYDDLNKVDNMIADVIISCHALEHCPNPWEIIKTAKKKLKSGGVIVIVVPSEQATDDSYNYKDNDINQHLFTWTPMTLGNLVKLAGFKLLKAEQIRHRWVGDFVREAQKNDLTVYHKQCREHALKTNNYQVRVVAQRID